MGVYSPPLTPMLGCSLADKMTSTIPIMNHSFRTLARRPMFQTPCSRSSPPASVTPKPENRSRTSSTSAHMGWRSTVKTGERRRIYQFVLKRRKKFWNTSTFPPGLGGGLKMFSGAVEMHSEKGSGNKSSSRSPSTPSLVFLLLLASCLTLIAPVGSQRTVSSDMSNLHSTDPPHREPNLLQETAIKPPTLLEKTKPKHNKLKHNKHEGKQSLNASLLLKRRPLSPPSCLKATSINTAFKYINTVLSCVIFRGDHRERHPAEDHLPK
ncbi:hypothetical protein F7725_004956 [Dissostichus mawsoni]|uniref:Uncharacterized protein n=1 Tax=Dissostichus mawsoni TaxID=36200 RepID=A0A7J5XK85_DISMA|nr:hypothetical protein F7725_004956 [Dissostichus mawsoni]